MVNFVTGNKKLETLNYIGNKLYVFLVILLTIYIYFISKKCFFYIKIIKKKLKKK
jgi:hypothetical protein